MHTIAAQLGPFDSVGAVSIDDGLIVDVAIGAPPPHAESFPDLVLAPGFIDLQVNGVAAIDFAAARDARDVAAALDAITTSGTTTCLPTLVTAPLDRYDEPLERIAAARQLPDAAFRCDPLGAHLEGPFLGGAPGAHPVALLRDADLAWIDALLDEHGSAVRMVTLAPEADPGFAATRMLHARGVLVALGHSDCTSDVARAGADEGARAVTHLFNGMSGLHHRTPGLANAALLDPRLTPTLIADFVHVHSDAIRLAFAVRDEIALVTDAVAPDAATSGGLAISERGGAVYLDDGTLAGSTLTMDAAVRNVVSIGVDLPRALAAATSIPARLVGAHDRGRLAAGLRADLVALDRETLHVQAVWIAGVRVR